MIVLALSLILLSDPAGAAAPAAPPAAPSLEERLKTAQETYREAQKLYDDSCETRAYAAYDDLCGQLGQRLHDYAVEVDRLTRKVEDQKSARARNGG